LKRYIFGHCAKIAKFLGAELRDAVLADFRNFIRRPESSRRLSSTELAQYFQPI
jgi:hypothetical protein